MHTSMINEWKGQMDELISINKEKMTLRCPNKVSLSSQDRELLTPFSRLIC